MLIILISTSFYLPLIHIIYPETEPLGSNPWEAPRTVTPKIGGLKLKWLISSLKTFFFAEDRGSYFNLEKSPVFVMVLTSSVIISTLPRLTLSGILAISSLFSKTKKVSLDFLIANPSVIYANPELSNIVKSNKCSTVKGSPEGVFAKYSNSFLKLGIELSSKV